MGRLNRWFRTVGRVRVAGTSALIGLVLASACVVNMAHAQSQAKPKQLGTLTLGWVRSTANLMAVIGPQVSEKYGLKVESKTFNTAQDISTAMISGEVDVGLLTPIHLIRAIDTKLEFVQICGNARGNTGIVAAKNLNLAENDWGGLKKILQQRKLRIVASRGSVNEMLAIAEFAKNGINVDKDLDLVNIANFAQHPQALRSGEFDMIVTLEPFITTPVADGIGTLFAQPYNTAAGDLNTDYVARRDWLTKNPELASAFVASMVDAARMLTSDKKLELETATKLLPLKPEILAAALAHSRDEVRNGLKQMQELARIAAERQYASRNVAADLPKFVESRFLKAAGIAE
jgi:ABC-type nitrate/sulfonate/bicarbonate transport system substrate-binding protein